MVALAPFIMGNGLQAHWYDVLFWSLVSYGVFVGLVLSMQTRDFIATPILLGLVSMVMASASCYDRDLALRDAFRREVATRRKLTSTVASSISRVVGQEMNQRFAELLKRLDTMATEVSVDGILQWCSPGTRRILAVEPEDVLRTDTFRYVHGDDIGALREVLARLVASGAAVAQLSPPVALGARPPSIPYERLPPETLLFSRLQFRRRRADGTSGHIWVEAELWPVIRRPTQLPGVSAPSPPGEITVMMIERDISYERRKAQQMGLPVTSSAAAQLPIALNAVVLAQAPEAREKEWAARYGGPAAPGGGGGATGGAGVPAYDPFHERSLYTAIAALATPLVAARTAALTASSLIATASQAVSVASASLSSLEDPSENVVAVGPGAAALWRSGSHATMQAEQTLGAAGRVLHAMSDSSVAALQLVSDALGVSRYRSRYIPVRARTVVNPQDMVSAAVEVAQQRLQLAASALAAARQIEAARSGLPPSPVANPREIAFPRADALPPRALLDRAKLEAALHMAFAVATSATANGAGDIAVHAEGRSTPTGLAVIRIVLSFDCGRMGGTEGLAGALAVDPLTSEAMHAPAPPNSVESLERAASLLFPEALVDRLAASPHMLLPLLRHCVLCVGGAIMAASSSDSSLLGEQGVGAIASMVRAGGGDTSVLASRAALVIDLPAEFAPGPLTAGPTAVDMSTARARIAMCPVDGVPGVNIPANSGLPPMQQPQLQAQDAPAVTQQPTQALPAVPVSAGPAQGQQPQYAGTTTVPGAREAGVPPGAVAISMLPSQVEAGAGAGAAPPPAPVAATPSRKATGSSVPLVQAVPVTQPGAAAGAPAAPEALSMHVLFVDDEQVNRRLGARMLARLNCSYRLVEDGELVGPALQEAAASGPRMYDAILMDIIMQQTDGAEVCRELREAGCTLPIIAMTGNTAVADVQRFLAAVSTSIAAGSGSLGTLGERRSHHIHTIYTHTGSCVASWSAVINHILHPHCSSPLHSLPVCRASTWCCPSPSISRPWRGRWWRAARAGTESTQRRASRPCPRRCHKPCSSNSNSNSRSISSRNHSISRALGRGGAPAPVRETPGPARS